MNKKTSALIAAVVVIIVVIAIVAGVFLSKPTTPTTTSKVSPPTAVSIMASTQLAPVGTPITFNALITGNATKVLWNFGDGTTGNGTTVNHTYQNPGSYLVEVNASIAGGYVTNIAKLFPITVTPGSISPSIASEVSQPVLTFNTTINKNAPIFSINESAIFVLSYLQPPSATNWSLAYYVINFGDGSSAIYPVEYNNTTGTFMSKEVTHIYTSLGIYPVSLTLITYNQTNFMSDLVINETASTEYLPTTYLSDVLSGQHYNMTTVSTIVVASPTETVGILKGAGNVPNPGVINVVELYPSGPYSLDPAITYEMTSFEIIANVYETLVTYNGSSLQFVPIIAKQVPSISNGLITPDGLNYTFYIRSGLKFANGDPVTVWDVYTSLVRDLLFMTGMPGTPGWVLAQDLLPGGGWTLNWSNGQSIYDNITRAITYNNATQSITFHLLKPDPAFLMYVADPWGSCIMDYNWLVKHGAGIEFTPSGFLNYTKYGNEPNYNEYIRWHAMGSGPYMIESYLSGQSILLVPNTNYTPITGVPGYDRVPTDKVTIQWVKDPETEVMMMQSGQADIVDYLPTNEFPVAESLQSQGKLNIYYFPTLDNWFFYFNLNVNTSMMQSIFGSQFHMPPHYFANLYVRKAFAYAFNYTNYLDNIIGNKVYHANFGFLYAGVILKGMPGYVPMQNLSNVPVYNLTLAKQFMEESGMYNVSVNIPIVLDTSEPIDYAAAAMWALNLSLMDPNIQASPVWLTYTSIDGYLIPGENPMPIVDLMWAPDYPYPSDYVNPLYLPGGAYSGGFSWNYTNLVNWGYQNEAQKFNNMTNLILQAESTSNETLALQLFDKAEQIAINLTMMVYTWDENGYWIYSPWIHGVQYEENPVFGSLFATRYIYLTKA